MRWIALILFLGLATGCSAGDKEAGATRQGTGGSTSFSAQGGSHTDAGAGGATQGLGASGGARTGAGAGNTALSGSIARPGTGGSVGATTVVVPGGVKYWGEAHTGNFWIGPVDYEETKFHNGCAPSVKYPAGIQRLYGKNIIGLANEMTLDSLTASEGQLCDVCAELSANGQTLIAHVVTFGQETGPTDMDVSLEVDDKLQGSTGRSLTWRFVSCPITAPIQYTFDGRQWSNTWFFRVWVRNARVPVSKLEYRVGTGNWMPATWQSDGAFQASGSDFSSGFSLRVTSIDRQSIEDAIPGLNTFDPDVGVASLGNFE